MSTEAMTGPSRAAAGLPLVVWLAIAGCAAAAPAGFDTTGHYTTKTPYSPPDPVVLPAPPVGFEPLMVQLVARHGSRPLSSPDDDDLSLQVWQRARADDALTPLGVELGPVLEDIKAVHQRIGYGAISERGVEEHEQMAARLLQRQPALFESAAATGRTVRVLHSGRERAEQSAAAFRRGLEHGLPELAGSIEPPRPAPELVYFNDAATTDAAAAYRRYRSGDARLESTLDRIHGLPQTRAMARRLLEAVYQPSFIDRLEAGALRFEAAADPDDVIDGALSAAQSLYALYAIAANLDREADWRFGRFIDPEAAAWFALVDDAETFYERGPGFADEDVTWRAAEVLLEDFIAGIEAVAAGVRTEVAVLRFSHAQALIPFAALLGIADAHESLPADVLYDYQVSDWRSERVSPMAANVQWDAFIDDGGHVLVRQLHNEQQVPFAERCMPWADAGLFYALDELRRCYALAGP